MTRRLTATLRSAVRRSAARGPFARLLEAAKRGTVDACFIVGRAYMTGKGAPHYPADAVKWLRRAAYGDHVEAQFCLSQLYLHGMQARTPARSWLDEANGSSRARLNAELLYPRGMDVPPNPEKAFGWATQAAHQGLARAQAHLGMLYLRGTGCTRDAFQAAAWFRLSAAQQDAGGALGLAIIHEHGLGVPADPVEALHWYRLAAERGNSVATAALTRLQSRPLSLSMSVHTSH